MNDDEQSRQPEQAMGEQEDTTSAQETETQDQDSVSQVSEEAQTDDSQGTLDSPDMEALPETEDGEVAHDAESIQEEATGDETPDMAQVGDGTSGSGSAEHGGPISGRVEGESDPDADSSATKLDTNAGGNQFMGTATGDPGSDESAPDEAMTAQQPDEAAEPLADASGDEVVEPSADESMQAPEAAPTAEMEATPSDGDTGDASGEAPAAAEETQAAPPAGGDTGSQESGEAKEVEATSGDTGAAPAPVRAPAQPQPQYQPQAQQQQMRRPDGDFGSGESDEMVVRSSKIGQVAANASMEDLMRASDQQFRPFKQGDVIEGTVMKVDREEILIDIGGKTEGVIPSREAQTMSAEEREALQIGDELLVSVVQPENAEGHVVLSLDRARQERAWRDLQRVHESGETITAQVVGHNKGGLLVNIEGIRGFIPSSQVSSLPPGEANKQAEMARLHNQELPLKVIEINRNRNRLILSERQAMQEQREAMRTLLLQELESGQIRPGTVTSVCDFGAFVDIGGADGLIHLSELSWKRVSHPSEVLKVGDRIDIYVLSVDPHERKIALSLKRTQPEPWDTITQQYTLGQTVRGTITQITTFGAFARLDDGIEGLIHVSELAEGRVQHPRNVVKEGEVHDLKVIRIDPARKRIGLSLKRAQEDAIREAGGEVGTEMGEDGMEQAGGGTGDETRREQPSQSQPSQQRQPQQPRERDRDRDRDRAPRIETNAPINVRAEEVEDLPMGAMAHAFAALQQRKRGDDGTDEGAEEGDGPTDAADTGDMNDPALDIAVEADTAEALGSLSGLTTSQDLDATDAMGGIELEPGTEADTTDVFPEADANAGSEAEGGDVMGAGPTITEPEAEAETEVETEADAGTASEPDGDTDAGATMEDEAATDTEIDSATDSGAMPADDAPAPNDETTNTGETGATDTDDDTAASEPETADETPSDEDAETAPAEDATGGTDAATDSGDQPAEMEATADEAEAQSSMPAATEASEASEAAEETGDGEAPDAEDATGMSGGEGAPSEADSKTTEPKKGKKAKES